VYSPGALGSAHRYLAILAATEGAPERAAAHFDAALAANARLGARSRTAAGAAERARVNVSRTIGAVMKKIAVGSPALGQHLTAAVRTGYFCSYTPDPRVRVDWTF